MEAIYLSTLAIVLIIMNVLIVRAEGKDPVLVRDLRRLVIINTVTAATSAISLFVPDSNVAMAFQCIHCAATEWVLIALLQFMESYTNSVKTYSWIRKSVYAFAVFNSVSFLANAAFHHVIAVEFMDANGVQSNIFSHVRPWFTVHEYFSYALAACSLILLLYQSIRSVRFYRKKYFFAFLMLLAAVSLEYYCGRMEFQLDYAMYVYAGIAIFLTYYSIYFTPHSVITMTLSNMVAVSNMGVICFDAENRCVYANDEICRILQHDRRRGLLGLEKLIEEKLHMKNFKQMENRDWQQDILYSEGKMRKIHCEIRFAKILDSKRGYNGCYFTIDDQTEEIERLRRERYRATHDALTNLSNAEYFSEQVLELLKHNADRKFYLVSLDIKDFKLVNELYGYEKGDEILKRLGSLLSNTLPQNALCARLVSDRFAFCVPRDLFNEQALHDCIRQVEKLISSNEYQLHIHAGVYPVTTEDSDVSAMCDRANMAIQTVKNDYERVVVYYDDELMERVIRERHMLAEFDHALEQGQFVMYLQPQVATDGTVLGAEALVRWIHPEQGMVPPGEFIEVFERAGLIHRLDMNIWEQAAKKLSEWKAMGWGNLHISVNISTKDFYYVDIYKEFTRLIEQYNISPEKLKLEITETALMMDLDKQLVLLEKLHQYGFQVEIDDFGSGYSSLNMLKDINADVLKIDMGFLRETQHRERTKIILNMIVSLAKQLQMTVITEGVESKDQADYLTQVGCDMFQGYYFSRPIPVKEFEQQYMQ